MDFDTVFKTRKFKIALGIIGGLILLIVVFGTGLFLGYREARFSYAWGENYDRTFGGPHRSPLGPFPPFFQSSTMPGSVFTNTHGTSGEVLSVDSSTLTVSGEDGIEKNILVSSATILRSHRDTIKLSDIKPDDDVIVIGAPTEQGQIQATLIRVLND